MARQRRSSPPSLFLPSVSAPGQQRTTQPRGAAQRGALYFPCVRASESELSVIRCNKVVWCIPVSSLPILVSPVLFKPDTTTRPVGEFWQQRTLVNFEHQIQPAWKAWGCDSCLTSLPFPTRPYLTILGLTWPYLTLLGLTGPYWATFWICALASWLTD